MMYVNNNHDPNVFIFHAEQETGWKIYDSFALDSEHEQVVRVNSGDGVCGDVVAAALDHTPPRCHPPSGLTTDRATQKWKERNDAMWNQLTWKLIESFSINNDHNRRLCKHPSIRWCQGSRNRRTSSARDSQEWMPARES